MARDIELFELLAASVDAHVDYAVPHRVVVPAADIVAFQRFASSRREIIAQEDVLPVSIWKAPSALRYLAFLRAGFRRPVYIAPGPRVVRGWMLQQFLKIDMAQRAEEQAIMHVDSDVGFFRRFAASQAFDGERPRFFRALGQTRNPMHKSWVASSCNFLGVPVPQSHTAHYIENCVLWSTDVTRAMVGSIETHQGKPLHEAIFDASTMSEYYLYGVFADLCGQQDCLAAEEVSFCNSYWPSKETDPVDFATLIARLQPKHCAIAVQSTHKLSVDDRRAIYKRAEAEMASG
ncbi:DUF6492 family protein [uncultured Roseobacter sp.]|uniref:DUF6492 family protein n=1 Tax=uncultured Roseobacter sp. TaxID=114847 RepID=UPI002633DDB2|nr:DUF6492 family protein [uncultured Roseobacter sp.]